MSLSDWFLLLFSLNIEIKNPWAKSIWFVQILRPATLEKTDFVVVANTVLLSTIKNKALNVLIDSHFNWDINFYTLLIENQFE